MKYCAITMKRQLEANEYQLKDWCINALTLSEAYLSRELYAQAEYLLYAAYNLIPEKEEGETKEMRAMIQCGIGRYYQRRLEVGVALYNEGSTLILDKVNEKLVEFPTLAQNWPEVTNMNGLEDAKKLFRLANTQFKKALDVYPLDGFVTEHVTTKQAISQCYKFLSKIEPDRDRVILMHQKRIELLEHMQGELSPTAYQVRMLEFGAELSDIYSDMYELELQKKAPNPKKIILYGQKTI